MDIHIPSILAKPSGITLEQHQADVMSEGVSLSEQIPFTFEKYEQRTGKNLLRRLELVCKYHDEGKKNEKWQYACQKDYESFLKWQAKNKGSFGDYSKENYNEAGKNIRNSGIRHEFQSLAKTLKYKMSSPLQTAIAAHHSKLSFRFEDRWSNEGCKEIWDNFRKESQHVIENYSFEQIVNKQYEYAGPRGLLQFIDHRASAKEEGDFVPCITPFNYKFPFESKREIQQLVEEHWQDDLLLVRAPTGSGKTDASLLWASLQIKNKRAGRLVIAMPTRFTSNALAINIAENLSNTGLYHSSAWFTKFQDQVEKGVIKKQKAERVHEFARLLETPVTVCTIDHLLTSLTLTREDQHLITFNLANSCLVIDEADFYDDFTQANILVLLEVLRYWKVPVLLMSASLPESVISEYQNIGYHVNQIIEDKSDEVRDRFKIQEIRNYSETVDIEDLLKLVADKGTGIIYVNTVNKAISLYQWFNEYNRKTARQVKVILYHSRFTESDKLKKEEDLINALGKAAWANEKAQGIAIMTQIGEMSINISADIMISEACPIDRLIQRTGRMCRFNKKTGTLYIINPYKNNSLYPAPYGHYDPKSKSWVACDGFINTMNIIKAEKYSAKLLVQVLNNVYAINNKHSTKSIENAKHLREYFSWNWLINPKQTNLMDEAETDFWQSRDIIANDIVFISKPDRYYYENYLEFQNWKIRNAIELPISFIKKGKERHMIDSMIIRIKDNEDTLYYIREGFYNNNIGPLFTENSEQFL